MRCSYFLVFLLFSFFSRGQLQSSESQPSAGVLQSSFFELSITDNEREIISKIIKTMAESSLPRLLWKKSEMESLGRKIHAVHPLRFLGHVFSNIQHVHHLHQISKSTFKWKAFIDGLSGRLKEESHRNNLLPHIEGFASQVNADSNKISEIVRDHKWEHLVRYLMEVSKSRA